MNKYIKQADSINLGSACFVSAKIESVVTI